VIEAVTRAQLILTVQAVIEAAEIVGRIKARRHANTAKAAITLAARKPFFRRLKLWLVEKLTDELPFLFIFNAREKFCSQSGYGLRFVERHLLVNLPALKMAWLALSLKNRLDLSLKVGLGGFGPGKARGGQD
jgi:hypothetical protein